jgi:hypothetical protein
MSDVTEGRLQEVIRGVYEKRRDLAKISPSWLATEAMAAIYFPRQLHDLGYDGCHLQFRQIARSFCRQHFDPEVVVENDLFPETLQQRYPQQQTDGSQEPVYVLLDLLSQEDILFNVERLRKEASAKLRHADALDAWRLRKFGRRTA